MKETRFVDSIKQQIKAFDDGLYDDDDIVRVITFLSVQRAKALSINPLQALQIREQA